MSSGTYESFEYVETNIPSELLCPVCKDPFVEPQVLRCDHTFCFRCLGNLTSQDHLDTVQCPLCRAPCSWRDVRKSERTIYAMVNRLNVYCRHRQWGCPAVVLRGNMKDHMRNECQYCFVQCPHDGCTMEMFRKFLSDHVAACPFRVVVHECGTRVKFCELEQHLKACSIQRTTCSHCGKDFHEVENRTAHESICEQRPIPCPHHAHGCDVSIVAKDVEAHLTTCTYEKMKNYIAIIDTKLKEAEEKLGEVRSQIVAAELRGRTQLEALESRIHRDTLQFRTYLEIMHTGPSPPQDPPIPQHPTVLPIPPRVGSPPESSATPKEDVLNIGSESPIQQPNQEMLGYASRQLQTHGTMIEFQWFITKLQKPKGSLVSPNFHLADLEWQLSVDSSDHGIYLAANGRAVYASYMISVTAGDLSERKKRNWVSVGEKEFGQMKWGTQGIMSLYYGKDIIVTAALLHVICPVNLVRGGEGWIVGVDSHHGTVQDAGTDRSQPLNLDRTYD
eukprot:PhF_6_TR15114/c0_g1_i2/m.23813